MDTLTAWLAAIVIILTLANEFMFFVVAWFDE